MLYNLGLVSEICNIYGMPILAIIYPRKEHAFEGKNYLSIKESNRSAYTKLVSHCVRIAFELGADIIKTSTLVMLKAFLKLYYPQINDLY